MALTSAELEDLVKLFVDVWVSELQRGGALRPDASEHDVQAFKKEVAATMLDVFKNIDGL